MEFGSVQSLVIGYDHGNFSGEVLAELRHLREQGLAGDVAGVVVVIRVGAKRPGPARASPIAR